MKLSSTFVFPEEPDTTSGIRLENQAWSAWPFRKDIRTFVKCFLATTCRNRVGQIGWTGKNLRRAFDVPLCPSPRCYQRRYVLLLGLFLFSNFRGFSRKISLLLLMKRCESRITLSTKQATKFISRLLENFSGRLKQRCFVTYYWLGK